jgi:3'(2'), 5'-bisphosphate nucleotidase
MTNSMNDDTNPCHLLDDIVSLARDAGKRIMEVYESEADFEVTRKEDHTPLTRADLAAHNAIVAGLELLTPDWPVLSEESAKLPFETRSSWPRYWLVDPLDGTREFIKRNGQFTVNIALIDGHRPIMGVIVVPVSGVTYSACIGHGAFRQNGEGAPVEQIHVQNTLRSPMTVAGSASHAGESLRSMLNKLGEHELLSMGSSLKLCLVAEGKADLYPRLGLTSEWDTGAAQAIVEEAGGHVTDTELQPLRYNTKDSLLNPHFLVFGDASQDWARYL